MPKAKPDTLLVLVNKIMSENNFSWTRRTEWSIWAAAGRECPTCSQPPLSPCLNMVDLNNGVPRLEAKINKQPHNDRIDRVKLIDGLRLRGYYTGQLPSEDKPRDADV